MKIENVKVYGLNESMIASGYPMRTETNQGKKTGGYKRLSMLGSAKSGSGHDSALKGIIVQYDLTCNHVMLPQFMRYHFHDIISSQSKMHKVLDMDLSLSCDEEVDDRIIAIAQEKIDDYKRAVEDRNISSDDLKYLYETIMVNLPLGLNLKMRVTSNYLQLKSIYNQRKNHKMSFWREYCKWVETLPAFLDFTTSKK